MDKIGTFNVRKIESYDAFSYMGGKPVGYSLTLPSGTLVQFIEDKNDSFAKVIEKTDGTMIVNRNGNIFRMRTLNQDRICEKFERWAAEMLKEIKKSNLLKGMKNGRWVR